MWRLRIGMLGLVFSMAGLACTSLSNILPFGQTATPAGTSLVAPTLPGATDIPPAGTPGATTAPADTPAPAPAVTVPTAVDASIAVQAPGASSVIISPVRVVGSAGVGDYIQPALRVQVFDQANNEIGSTTVTPVLEAGQSRGTFETTVDFTAPAGEQPGRVVVSSLAQNNNGLVALSAVAVTLSTARFDITPVKDAGKPFTITVPPFGATLSGGTAQVGGIGFNVFNNQLAIEIRDAQGSVVGIAPATVTVDASGSGPYTVSVNYTVDTASLGRVVVFSQDATGSTSYLASVEVVLQP